MSLQARCALVTEFHPTALPIYPLETQPFGIGCATRCHQHRIGGDRLAIVEVDEQRAVRLFFDRLEGRVEAELDALCHRDLQQAVADLLVIAAQDRVSRPEVPTSELPSLMRHPYAVICSRKKNSSSTHRSHH